MSTSAARPSLPSIHSLETDLRPIPEESRTNSVSAQFWIWAGANIAPINWVLGALGITLGLGFADTVTVLVLGNLIGMLLFGLFVLLGQRTGATGMVLGRAAFGRRGNYLPACIQAVLSIGWSAVNTWIILDLVMALFGELGWVDPDGPNYGAKIAVAATIMAIQVAISWIGFRAISAFERWTVPPTLVVLVAMSAVAWFGGMDIDWGYAGRPGEVLTGMDRIAAMTAVMTAIGIGWGITWFTYAADYSRFVSRQMSRRRLYSASVLGQFIPVVWLGVLGASLATTHGSIDPGQLIVENYGSLAVPVLLLVVHGPIATNILNIYTFSVATQALDVNVSRRTLSSVVGAFSMAVVIAFIFAGDFATVLDSWLVGLVAWVATWGGIMLVHYYWLERHTTDVSHLFERPAASTLPAINWAGYVAFALGILATWLCMHGVVEPLQGPVSRALGGVDFSWLAGGLTSATVYAVLAPRIGVRTGEVLSDGSGAPQPASVPPELAPLPGGSA